MKKEDIENQGRIEREKVIKELQEGYNKHHDINLYTAASATIGQYALPLFVAGAKWRINSVWHDVKENPTERKIIIALSRDGCMTECDFTYDHRIFTWIDIVKSQNIIKWCYKEDILPDTEE